MFQSRISSSALALSLIATTAFAQDCSKTCQSFGKDFANNGTYFQNVASNDDFTALQYFEGCQADNSYNMLVAPDGNQIECSQTPMTPDDATQQLTCPIEKSQLSSGEWQIIVISNNGQCDPIDYVRSFSLIVGTQVTTTVPQTIVVTSTSTPIVSQTVTTSTMITSIAKPRTTTVQGAAKFTYTYYSLPSITYTTRGVFTAYSTKLIPHVVATTTSTLTAPCNAAATASPAFAENFAKQEPKIKDPINTRIIITVGNHPTQAIATSTSKKARRAAATPLAAGSRLVRRALSEQRIQVRQIRRRSPDEPTVTVTNPSSSVTSTHTDFAPTTTITGTTTIIRTTTTTPVVTVTGPGAPLTTVTASAKTITNVFWVPVQYATITRTQDVTKTATATVSAC